MAKHEAKNILPLRADGYANTEFTGAQGHVVRQHAVQPHRRQQQRQNAESGQRRRFKAQPPVGLPHVLAQRADAVESDGGVRRHDRFADCICHRTRIGASLNQQRLEAATIGLRKRPVDVRQGRFPQGPEFGIAGDSNDLQQCRPPAAEQQAFADRRLMRPQTAGHALIDDGDSRAVWAPGGRLLLLEVTGARPALAVQSLDTGERRVLAQDARFARSVGRSIVWMENGRIVGAPFDPARLALSGPPVAIPTDGLDAGQMPTALDVAASGSLIVLRGSAPASRGSGPAPITPVLEGLVWIDRRGTTTRVATREGICFDPRLSPDGARVALDGSSGGSDLSDVWTVDLRRGALSRLSFGDGEDETAVWSPDGAWIAWASSRAGEGRSLYRRHSDGSRAEERLWVSDGRHFHASSWTPDGRGIVVTVDDPKTGWDVLLVTLGPKPTAKPLLTDPFNETSARVSPDGRYEIYAQAFPDLGRKVQISVAGGSEPIWHPRGGEIVYRSAASRHFMSATVQAKETLVLSPPRVLVSDAGLVRGEADHTHYDVAPDGRLLAVEEAPAGERVDLHIILGWAQSAGLLR